VTALHFQVENEVSMGETSPGLATKTFASLCSSGNRLKLLGCLLVEVNPDRWGVTGKGTDMVFI
jgi:hypothetical protein